MNSGRSSWISREEMKTSEWQSLIRNLSVILVKRLFSFQFPKSATHIEL